jgi:hypothetical protein
MFEDCERPKEGHEGVALRDRSGVHESLQRAVSLRERLPASGRAHGRVRCEQVSSCDQTADDGDDQRDEDQRELPASRGG